MAGTGPASEKSDLWGADIVKAFVTVGLERLPFSRLLAFVNQAVECKLLSPDSLVQHGHTVFPSPKCRDVDFLPFSRMQEAIEKAELVITHAGVGSILLSLNAGRMPIVVPREGSRGEHVDDHQVEFAEVMDATGKIKAAYSEKDFFFFLCQAKQWDGQLPLATNLGAESELVKSLKILLKEQNNLKIERIP